MENTIQSAEEFIQWAQHSFENETGEIGSQAEWMVAYAKEVATSACYAPSSIGEDEIVKEAYAIFGTYPTVERVHWMAGAKWAISRLSERKIVLPSEVMPSEGGKIDYLSHSGGWNECLSEIKRLNGIN